MAITTAALVKTISRQYDHAGTSAPTTLTAGEVGDIYLNTDSGLSYVCTAADTVTPEYTWDAYTRDDAIITQYINKAENDYLKIRGVAFDTDDDDNIEYPDNADITAAEMVCFLLGWGIFDSRGNASQSIGGNSKVSGKKILGYDIDIVGSIEAFHRVT